MVKFEEMQFARADFLVNTSPYLKPKINPLNDLSIRVSNRARRKEVEKYAEKNICLLVFSPSDDEKKINEKFVGAQEEFLVSEGRKKFQRRLRERLIGEISSEIKRQSWLLSFQKTIKELVRKELVQDIDLKH